MKDLTKELVEASEQALDALDQIRPPVDSEVTERLREAIQDVKDKVDLDPQSDDDADDDELYEEEKCR